MKFIIQFRCRVNGTEGVALHGDISPFIVVIQGTQVRIVPEVDDVVVDDDCTESFLTSLCSEIEYEAKSTKLPKQLHLRYRDAASEALRRTLVHLRAATNYPSIDVHLSSFQHERYLDAHRNPADGGSLILDFSLHDSLVDPLTPDIWSSVQLAVAENRQRPVEGELLHEARCFLLERNFAMALLNAAIVCEISIRGLISQSLSTKGLGDSEISVITKSLNNQTSRELTESLGLLDHVTSKNLDYVFRLRNQIVHYKEGRGDKATRLAVTSNDVRLAISCARQLMASLNSLRGLANDQ